MQKEHEHAINKKEEQLEQLKNKSKQYVDEMCKKKDFHEEIFGFEPRRLQMRAKASERITWSVFRRHRRRSSRRRRDKQEFGVRRPNRTLAGSRSETEQSLAAQTRCRNSEGRRASPGPIRVALAHRQRSSSSQKINLSDKENHRHAPEVICVRSAIFRHW